MKHFLSKLLFFSLLLLYLPTLLMAQEPPPGNLYGSSLRAWLKSNWYDGKHQDLGYNAAREAMYNDIDYDSSAQVIRCVYSGYEKSFVADGSRNVSPIDCEHSVPQSFFDSNNPMRSDIYHLFPTYNTWNSTRGNLPFGNIVDNQADKWIRGSNSQSNVPSSNIEEYSEVENNVQFEPREDHKGNVARAIFYFYTMYPTQAGSISNIVNGSLSTLLQWHENDPPDASERKRNDETEAYQGNRNPYVDYPEIAAYAWELTSQSPQIYFEHVSQEILEGDAGSVSHSFNVLISPAPSSNLSVEVAIKADASTAQSNDYQFTTQTLNFSPSISSQSVSIDILGDEEAETNEIITLELRNASAANIGVRRFYEITILDNETISRLEPIAWPGLEIFPNPNTGSDWLYINSPRLVEQFTLKDAQGKIWLSKEIHKKSFKLNLHNLPHQVYFLELYDHRSHTLRRIVR